MSSDDPTRTVHFVIARMAARRFGGDRPALPQLGDSILAWSISSEHADPDGRSDYTGIVNYAWALLGFGCGFLMVVLSYVAHLLISDRAVKPIVVTMMD